MNPTMLAAIQRARENIAARQAVLAPTLGQKILDAAREQREEAANAGEKKITLNAEQQLACTLALSGKSFCFIGSAGTGKTTTTKELIKQMMAANKLPILERSTKWLNKGRPGVVLISYTRRAVRNIAKQMPEDFKPHCITYHKLMEYQPETVETPMPDGKTRISKPFMPQRRRGNPLPSNLRLVIIDEASMLSTDFFRILLAGLSDPEQVQFIFIGDINQLPPVYGDGILGIKMNQLPTVELVTVYRQALESPIINLAIQVKNNNIPPDLKVVTKDRIIESTQGKVVIIPWKQKLNLEDAEHAIHLKLTQWVKSDYFNFEEDVILCPWGKSFGTINMNKSIGTAIAHKHERPVHEIIAGFNKHYFSLGDRVMFDKRDAIVTKIAENTRYIGKKPQPASSKMDYWGWGSDASAAITESVADIDALLDKFSDAIDEDRTQEASHAMTIKYLDDDSEYIINRASDFNICDLGYAMSVHKSQGSEWRRVFIILHDAHIKMVQRELLYTAITRASQELHVIMPPTALNVGASRAKIKGISLEDKKKWFMMKYQEMQRKLQAEKAKKQVWITSSDDDEDD